MRRVLQLSWRQVRRKSELGRTSALDFVLDRTCLHELHDNEVSHLTLYHARQVPELRGSLKIASINSRRSKNNGDARMAILCGRLVNDDVVENLFRSCEDAARLPKRLRRVRPEKSIAAFVVGFLAVGSIAGALAWSYREGSGWASTGELRPSASIHRSR